MSLVNADGRHAHQVAALCRAVLESPGFADPATRVAAYRGDDLPSPLREYLAKVRDASWRITDKDVDELLASGCSQDSVFELTVAAALGAAMQQLESGLRLIRGGP